MSEASLRARRLVPLLPLAVATIVIARTTVRSVIEKVGHPGAPLDDAYIHFQYARAIAEGHPMRYQAGEPISTGATSFVWPALLALPHALGLRGEAVLWAAWALSYAALAGLAWEARSLTNPLAGRGAAIGAAAMTLLFGGFVWCAASGMEVVPFAWLVAHATRRAAEWVELPERRTRRELRWLFALALLAPLTRPEGAITSFVLAAAVLVRPLEATARGRARAVALVVAALAPQLLLLLLTGRATSSTAEVKLLFGNPYYSLSAATLANAKTLVGTILNGEVWSAEFLPKGAAPVALAGLVALAWRGHASGRIFRAGAILILALSMFVPCTYVTFLWNRLRYLWPFATGWLIGAACLARAVGAAAAVLGPRTSVVTTALVAGGFAGALSMRLDWVIEDVAQSASGIHRQQVALGHWARENLPKDARIGVNDTGAIAYFGDRRTFDVVGLTTPTEGRYWVAGQASRVEHYERLRREAPGLLPTHFIVYPDWMGCEPVLGRMLHEAVVTDSSILGGQAMRVFEARWDGLGTGEQPWSPHRAVLDALDVADLESEAAHRYELLGARDNEQVVAEGAAPGGALVLDGGRTNRTRDRFVLRGAPGDRRLRLVARVEVTAPAVLALEANGERHESAPLTPGTFREVELAVPATASGTDLRCEVKLDAGELTSFHYWLVE